MQKLPGKDHLKINEVEYDPFVRRVEMRWDKVESRKGFPWSLPFLRSFEYLDFRKPVTYFVGENGSGKSTLLEGIAESYGLNSEGGSRNHNFSTTSHRSPIAPYLRLVKSPYRPQTEYFVRAESMYNLLSNYEDMGKYGEPLSYLHFRSHGEGLLELVTKRFGNQGFYLMDEPESALSPQNQLALICRMAQLIKVGSQFIIATHSPILLAFPNSQLIEFGADGMKPTEYRDTEHYLITRQLLQNPEEYMARLLNESS